MLTNDRALLNIERVRTACMMYDIFFHSLTNSFSSLKSMTQD